MGHARGCAPRTPLLRGNTAYGNKWVNQDLEILNFVIFDVFNMKYDQIPHLYLIFGTFSKFWYLINPFIPTKFSFFANFFPKNVVLRNGFWHDLEVH